MPVKNRTIFTRDNLEVLRGMEDGCIDLIYLDPPFNSNADYAAPVGSPSDGAAFKDTWCLSDINLAWHGQIEDSNPGLYSLLTATRAIHGKSMMSYLIYMAVRMLEIHRVLKDDGSLYLHCDPHASHYLKLMMDAIFGKGLKNEVVWFYTDTPGRPKTYYPRKHDVLFFYTKGKSWTFNDQDIRVPIKEASKDRYRYSRTLGGKDYLGGEAVRKGKVPEDVWLMPTVKKNSREATGYPTQKPLALLERIIRASSDEGDMVMDPFCGCATACIAAERLGRQWVGIDLSVRACELVKQRLLTDLAIGSDESPALLGEVIHRTDAPDDRPGQKSSDRNIKDFLYGQQDGLCNGCKVHFRLRNMTIDHIVPRSKGGSDADGNKQLLCGACNSLKGNRPQEYLLTALEKIQ